MTKGKQIYSSLIKKGFQAEGIVTIPEWHLFTQDLTTMWTELINKIFDPKVNPVASEVPVNKGEIPSSEPSFDLPVQETTESQVSPILNETSSYENSLPHFLKTTTSFLPASGSLLGRNGIIDGDLPAFALDESVVQLENTNFSKTQGASNPTLTLLPAALDLESTDPIGTRVVINDGNGSDIFSLGSNGDISDLNTIPGVTFDAATATFQSTAELESLSIFIEPIDDSAADIENIEVSNAKAVEITINDQISFAPERSFSIDNFEQVDVNASLAGNSVKGILGHVDSAKVNIKSSAFDDDLSIGNIMGDNSDIHINSGSGKDSVKLGNINDGHTVVVNTGDGDDAIYLADIATAIVDDSGAILVVVTSDIFIDAGDGNNDILHFSKQFDEDGSLLAQIVDHIEIIDLGSNDGIDNVLHSLDHNDIKHLNSNDSLAIEGTIFDGVVRIRGDQDDQVELDAPFELDLELGQHTDDDGITYDIYQSVQDILVLIQNDGGENAITMI